MYTGVGRREDTNSPVTTRLIQEVADSETITGMLNHMRDISHGRTCIRGGKGRFHFTRDHAVLVQNMADRSMSTAGKSNHPTREIIPKAI